MPLSWNEIKDRALRFSREWAGEASEDAEAKSFWDGFFDVFGVSRRRVAHFERKVKKLDGKDGYIEYTCSRCGEQKQEPIPAANAGWLPRRRRLPDSAMTGARYER